MGLFNNPFNKMKKELNLDNLQAFAASCMWMAASDGSISKTERDKTEALLLATEELKVFKPADIRKQVDKYASLLETDFDVGRLKMEREIADISGDPEIAETCFVLGLAVAKDGGGIDEKEKTQVLKLARMLGVNAANYGVS